MVAVESERGQWVVIGTSVQNFTEKMGQGTDAMVQISGGKRKRTTVPSESTDRRGVSHCTRPKPLSTVPTLQCTTVHQYTANEVLSSRS